MPEGNRRTLHVVKLPLSEETRYELQVMVDRVRRQLEEAMESLEQTNETTPIMGLVQPCCSNSINSKDQSKEEAQTEQETSDISKIIEETNKLIQENEINLNQAKILLKNSEEKSVAVKQQIALLRSLDKLLDINRKMETKPVENSATEEGEDKPIKLSLLAKSLILGLVAGIGFAGIGFVILYKLKYFS